MNKDAFVSMKELAKRSAYSEWQIRHYVKKRLLNGLDPYVIKIKNVVYINERGFNFWEKIANKKPSVRKHKRNKKKNYQISQLSFKTMPVECTLPIQIQNNMTNQGVSNDDGICRMATVPHRAGFFKRFFGRFLPTA